MCWELSKCLIFGLFVCLLRDGFCIMLFVSVLNREVKFILKGIVDLKFEKIYEEMVVFLRDVWFVMVEIMVYFEVYKYVLYGF